MERCASLGSLHKLELEQHGDWRDKWATECSDWQRLITGIKNVDVEGAAVASAHAKDRERWLTHIKQVKDEVEVDRASVDPNSCEIFTPPDAPLELAKSEGGDPVFQLATARVAPSAGGLEPEPEPEAEPELEPEPEAEPEPEPETPAEFVHPEFAHTPRDSLGQPPAMMAQRPRIMSKAASDPGDPQQPPSPKTPKTPERGKGFMHPELGWMSQG